MGNWGYNYSTCRSYYTPVISGFWSHLVPLLAARRILWTHQHAVFWPWVTSHLQDHPRTCKWLITMVIINPLNRIVGPLINGRNWWLINEGDPNYLLVLGWSSKQSLQTRETPRNANSQEAQLCKRFTYSQKQKGSMITAAWISICQIFGFIGWVNLGHLTS